MISVKNITKQYGKGHNIFTALDDVSFEVLDHSSVAIIGKSGSGKSTLMHIMSGLDRPTTGTITINNKNLLKMTDREMDHFRATSVGFVFQSFFIEANQTVFQNVMLPLEIAKVPPRKRAAIIKTALKAVELTDKASTSAGKLSGGQKQRLAVARAIVNKPEILFADEPTGNLDSATGNKVMELLFDLNKRLGCTLILVTHDVDLANRCEMQVTIKDGKIESVRTPSPSKAAK
ncbi:MAG: ABC transporter ATP-binding protein [Candidatus Saccharibacteria bacterium]